jgi:hypothetical protein
MNEHPLREIPKPQSYEPAILFCKKALLTLTDEARVQSCLLLPLFVSFALVLLHDCACGYFLRTLPIAP